MTYLQSQASCRDDAVIDAVRRALKFAGRSEDDRALVDAMLTIAATHGYDIMDVAVNLAAAHPPFGINHQPLLNARLNMAASAEWQANRRRERLVEWCAQP